jgi:hypothetical protein
MADVREVLAYAILKELEKCEEDGLVALLDETTAWLLARRLAAVLTHGREQYRSGRRGFDRLRDKLWDLLRWRLAKGRRVNDARN